MYGKQTECAIGCASRLAEVFDGGKTRLNAAEIAAARGLQPPSVAKFFPFFPTLELWMARAVLVAAMHCRGHPSKLRFEIFLNCSSATIQATTVRLVVVSAALALLAPCIKN